MKLIASVLLALLAVAPAAAMSVSGQKRVTVQIGSGGGGSGVPATGGTFSGGVTFLNDILQPETTSLFLTSGTVQAQTGYFDHLEATTTLFTHLLASSGTVGGLTVTTMTATVGITAGSLTVTTMTATVGITAGSLVVGPATMTSATVLSTPGVNGITMPAGSVEFGTDSDRLSFLNRWYVTGNAGEYFSAFSLGGFNFHGTGGGTTHTGVNPATGVGLDLVGESSASGLYVAVVSTGVVGSPAPTGFVVVDGSTARSVLVWDPATDDVAVGGGSGSYDVVAFPAAGGIELLAPSHFVKVDAPDLNYPSPLLFHPSAPGSQTLTLETGSLGGDLTLRTHGGGDLVFDVALSTGVVLCINSSNKLSTCSAVAGSGCSCAP